MGQFHPGASDKIANSPRARRCMRFTSLRSRTAEHEKSPRLSMRQTANRSSRSIATRHPIHPRSSCRSARPNWASSRSPDCSGKRSGSGVSLQGTLGAGDGDAMLKPCQPRIRAWERTSRKVPAANFQVGAHAPIWNPAGVQQATVSACCNVKPSHTKTCCLPLLRSPTGFSRAGNNRLYTCHPPELVGTNAGDRYIVDPMDSIANPRGGRERYFDRDVELDVRLLVGCNEVS